MQVPSLLQIEAELPPGSTGQNALGQSATTASAMHSNASRPSPFSPSAAKSPAASSATDPRSDWSRGLTRGGRGWHRNLQFLRSLLRRCMQREVQHKVRGEMRTDIQYYHRIVAV